MPAVVEFTMKAKPGHYDEVMQKYIAFADAFVETDPNEELALITGDPASGTIRGIGLYDTQEAGGAANSRASMAAFMDEVADLIDGAPVRIEMDLVHAYIKV
jgi:quinol monooxygenase YgiN